MGCRRCRRHGRNGNRNRSRRKNCRFLPFTLSTRTPRRWYCLLRLRLRLLIERIRRRQRQCSSKFTPQSTTTALLLLLLFLFGMLFSSERLEITIVPAQSFRRSRGRRAGSGSPWRMGMGIRGGGGVHRRSGRFRRDRYRSRCRSGRSGGSGRGKS